MKKKKQPDVDAFIDALVWMRRKAKKHEPVDDLIDALIKMRRKAKRKLKVGGAKQAKKKRVTGKEVARKRS